MRARRNVKLTTQGGKEKGVSMNVEAKHLKLSAKKRSDTSRQVENEDAFETPLTENYVLATPYNMVGLDQVFEKSNILRQCAEAMETNLTKFGFRAVPIDKDTEADPKELRILEDFIKNCNIDESFGTVAGHHVFDYEKFGHSYFEVIRDASGKVSLLRHAKAFKTRLCKKDGGYILRKRSIKRGDSVKIIKEQYRFRRYVQIVNGDRRYFKEFGDPRRMSYKTGRFEEDDYKVKDAELATELLHRRQFSEDAYGTPRWIGQLPNILGSRESEEVNLRYFEDNTVPPMMLLVTGGRITQQSFQALNDQITAQSVGKDRQHQILLIEAIPETGGLDENGSVDLKVEKLADARQSDALFGAYDESNISKVRSTFRLPPVFLGLSQDVTFATANVSAYLAETQVFSPERTKFDEFVNMRIVNAEEGMGLKTVKLQSRGPSVTNPEQIVKAMTAGNTMGAITPRTAIALFNEFMQLALPQYPEKGDKEYEEWMDMPMALSQKVLASKTQQTGEGTDPDGQAGKDQDIKDREKDGTIEPEAVEHGQE